MLEAWKLSFMDSLTHSWDGVATFLPSLLAALLVLLVCIAVALTLKRLIVLVAGRVGLDELSRRAGFEDLLSKAGIESSSVELIGTVLFWVVFLSFLVSATETIGLPSLSSTIQSLVLCLPRVAGALLILVLGFVLATMLRCMVANQCGLGVVHSTGVAAAVYRLLVIVAGTMAISQLEIETDLLKLVIAIGR